MLGLVVLHLQVERCRDTIDQTNIPEGPGSVQLLFAVIFYSGGNPEVFGHPGNIPCIFAGYLRSNFNDVAGFVVYGLLPKDFE